MSLYGTLIGITVVIGVELLKEKNKKILYLDILFLLFLILISSRVLFLLHNIEGIRAGIIRPLYIWEGGLTFYGALVGLLLGLYIISKYRKIDFFSLTDTILLYLPLFHSIGRLGNYFNNELYGKPSNLPWAISIPLEQRDLNYLEYSHFHPVFLYESVLNLFHFILLFYISKRYTKKGLITSIYLISYASIRLFTNIFRIDKGYILGIESSYMLSIISLLTGILILLIIMKKKELLAKLFSRILPPVLVLLTSVSIVLKIDIPLHYQISFLLLTFILPILITLIFRIFNITSNLTVSKREERPKLFLLFLPCLLTALYLSFELQNPLLIQIYSVLNLTFLLGLVITFYWKISFHMIISVLMIFFTILLWNLPFIYLLLISLPLIGWSRLQLERHSIKQVIGGVLLPIFVIVLILVVSRL